MATENTVIAVKITAESEGAKNSVKSFKTQLKEATAELVTMSEKFGVTSTEAANAARKVAGLKDAIGDAKALAETFNPDKKFVALGGALQGAVGGFSALQGAMGLFGSEGKEVEKMMLKVQSAMALQQGISSVMGAVDSFQLLGSTIVKKVVTAFSTLKGAIVSTGIGLLVIAIGFAVSKLMEWNDQTNEQVDSEKDLKRQEDLLTESLKKRNDEIAKTISLTDYSTNKSTLEARARGASEKEVYEITKKGLEETVLLLQQERDNAEQNWRNALEGSKAKIDAEKVYRDALDKSQKAFQQYETLQAQGKLDEANRTKDANAKALDEKKKRDEEKKAADAKKLAEQKAIDEETRKQFRQNLKNQQEDEDAAYQSRLKQDNLNDEEKLKRQEEINNEIIAFENKRIENKKIAASAEKQIQDATFANIEAGLNLLQSLAGKNKALQAAALIAESAVGIAKIIINTQTANALAKASPINLVNPGYGIMMSTLNTISAGIGIAANLKATATGLRGLNSGGAPSAPGGLSAVGGTSAPLTPQAQSTRLDQGSINAIGQASARSYVLESDITSHQERIQRLQRAARIN